MNTPVTRATIALPGILAGVRPGSSNEAVNKGPETKRLPFMKNYRDSDLHCRTALIS